MSELSLVLISALISGGVSLGLTIAGFFGGKICNCIKSIKKFRRYKEYSIEFLKQYLYFFETKKIKYYDKEYELDDLSIMFFPNMELGYEIRPMVLPAVILCFIKENKVLSNKESSILTNIIIQMSKYDKIFLLDVGAIEQEDGQQIKIEFLRFEITADQVLARGLPDEYICSLIEDSTDTENKLKVNKLLKDLEAGEFDRRIKDIIKNMSE